MEGTVKRKNPISFIFFTSLMEWVALGMMIPLHPYIARHHGADDLEVGLLMSVYSLVQGITAPFWGKLSDRYGRRPILLTSLAITSLSYLWFALAPNLSHLFFSRILAGLFGAGMSTAFAFVSDRTSAHNRSKNIGVLGATFGLGFVMGPAIGGVIGAYSSELSTVAFGSFGICLIGFLLAFLTLHDTPKQKINSHTSTVIPSIFSRTFYPFLRDPALRKTLFLFFILSLSLTIIEAPLFLFMKDQFQWPQSLSSIGFAYIGLMLALSQGWWVRYLIPYFGEKQTSQLGFLLMTIGLLSMHGKEIYWIAVAVTMLSLGFGFTYTSLTGVMTLLSQKSEKGSTLGIHQSISSVCRIVGPVAGGFLYRDYQHTTPFLIAGMVSLLGLFFAFCFRNSIPSTGQVYSQKKHTNHTKKDLLLTEENLDNYLIMEWDQLTNLIQNQVPFSLFYLMDKNQSDPATFLKKENTTIKAIIKKIVPIHSNQLHHLDVSIDQPMVLICKDGCSSQKMAHTLSQKYKNVFYLKGGILSYQEVL